MKVIIKSILFALLFLPTILFPQIDRETRAVWVASNFHLDWPPPTFDPAEQKQALIEILDNIESKNLNTVYFQVRFNGTVLFNSSLEPWSFYLTGTVGGTPTYDPLQFAIEEAHKRGLEIHAWVNVIRAFNGNEQNILSYPYHVTNIHPNWVQKTREGENETYWLDPGLPEVRQYLIKIVAEIVQQYDVDGIQLDFIRYPEIIFDDSFAYSIYGNGKTRDDWRRDNITNIVRGIKDEIDRTNPKIKFGAAPIGIYQNIKGARGLQAYSEVYQDSREWLREKLIDYVVPQIYWDFEHNPKFDLLVNDWVNNSGDRNVVIGIASYKDEVKIETSRMIQYVRLSGAEGIAFFRYSFIKNDTYFTTKAVPSPMYWKDDQAPLSPVDLQVHVLNEKENTLQLTWMLPELMLGAQDVKYYALFDPKDQFENLSSRNLFKIIPAERATISFSLKKPSAVYNYYAVKSLDRFWNESINSTNTAVAELPKLVNLTQNVGIENEVVLTKTGTLNPAIILTSANNTEIKINFLSDEKLYKTVTKKLALGINIFELDENNFDSIEIEFDSGKKMRVRM